METPRKITAEDLLRMRFPSEPRLAPDGRRLFFVSDRGAGGPQGGPGPVPGQQLWMLPLDGGEPHALTRLEEGAVSEPLPSPDGAHLAFLYRAKLAGVGAADMWP